MKRIVLFSLAFLPLLAAQDVRMVSEAAELMVTTQSPISVVTASQGDGTSCAYTKLAAPVITYMQSCANSATAQLLPDVHVITGTSTTSAIEVIGDVTCVLGFNPTSQAVAMGSLGSVGAGSLVGQCSTFIRAAATGGVLGAITGQTAPVTFTAQWP